MILLVINGKKALTQNLYERSELSAVCSSEPGSVNTQPTQTLWPAPSNPNSETWKHDKK